MAASASARFVSAVRGPSDHKRNSTLRVSSLVQYSATNMRIFALVILAALAALCTAINVPVNQKISQGKEDLSASAMYALMDCIVYTRSSVISKTYETVHPQVIRKTRPTRNVSLCVFTVSSIDLLACALLLPSARMRSDGYST